MIVYLELLSEQQLSGLLPPSLRYLLVLATHRYPRYLIHVLNNYDEAYLGLSLLIERHFLRTYGGGFTENFYGLKRERVLRVKGGEIPRAQLGAPGQVRETLKLRNKDVWLNLGVMCVLPYIKRKLDEGYDIHAAAANTGVLGPGFQNREQLPHDASIRQRFMYYYKWFLRKVYPSVNAAYYFAILAFNLAYLFDSSKFHNPFFWLIGTRIRRMGEADYKAIDLASQPSPSAAGGARPGETNSIFSPRAVARVIIPKLFSSLRILLPTSIFALKFLEWWHASDFARQLSRKAAEGLELPPPVVSGLARLSKSNAERSAGTQEKKQSNMQAGFASKPSPPISASSYLPILTVPAPTKETSHLCPICGEDITNPTASPYGYVFCYTCIHKWVEGEHDRQTAFMEGNALFRRQTDGDGEMNDQDEDDAWGAEEGSREGRWESGKDRCAVTGKRVLGGTEGLRRVLV